MKLVIEDTPSDYLILDHDTDNGDLICSVHKTGDEESDKARAELAKLLTSAPALRKALNGLLDAISDLDDKPRAEIDEKAVEEAIVALAVSPAFPANATCDGLPVCEITVVVEGGVVQDVIGVPAGIQVCLHDYDTDGSDDDLFEDEDGDKFISSTWFHESSSV